MLDGMARKITHELTGTRKGVSVTLKIKAPANLNVEPVLDHTEAFLKNQIDAAVPKNQEQMDLTKGDGGGAPEKPRTRRTRPKKDGKAAAAGPAAH